MTTYCCLFMFYAYVSVSVLQNVVFSLGPKIKKKKITMCDPATQAFNVDLANIQLEFVQYKACVSDFPICRALY